MCVSTLSVCLSTHFSVLTYMVFDDCCCFCGLFLLTSLRQCLLLQQAKLLWGDNPHKITITPRHASHSHMWQGSHRQTHTHSHTLKHMRFSLKSTATNGIEKRPRSSSIFLLVFFSTSLSIFPSLASQEVL